MFFHFLFHCICSTNPPPIEGNKRDKAKGPMCPGVFAREYLRITQWNHPVAYVITQLHVDGLLVFCRRRYICTCENINLEGREWVFNQLQAPTTFVATSGMCWCWNRWGFCRGLWKELLLAGQTILTLRWLSPRSATRGWERSQMNLQHPFSLTFMNWRESHLSCRCSPMWYFP